MQEILPTAEVQESILSDLCYIIPRVIATLQNLQESSSLSYTPCPLTRDDRKVRSGKLSMHEKMFQCYSVLIKHIEGCPADRSTVV